MRKARNKNLRKLETRKKSMPKVHHVKLVEVIINLSLEIIKIIFFKVKS